MLLEHLRDLDRAVDFAQRVEEDAVWLAVGKAQLAAGNVSLQGSRTSCPRNNESIIGSIAVVMRRVAA